MQLTGEQQAVIDLALAPSSIPPEGSVVRVTSGAGTGKTTVVEAFAKRLKELGHRNVVYLTFNKSAAADAQSRVGKYAQCRTLHAAAFAVSGMTEAGTKLIDDVDLQRITLQNFDADIEQFIGRQDAMKPPERNQLKKKLAFFISKTLTRFLHSANDETLGFSPTEWFTTYYPAKMWHEKDPKCPLGRKYGDFYVRHAKELYQMVRPKGLLNQCTYDTVMKDCQVKGMLISDATAILVDESQDCNECQINWALSHKSGRQIMFVGDAVQTIYGFRGSKSKFLMSLKNCHDVKLTKSFRFGPAIAAAANLVLFAKEKSPQTDWKPYRLQGAGATNGRVFTAEESKMHPDLKKRTILAWKNVSLMSEVLENYLSEIDTLKIAIAGEGSNSGVSKWKRVCKEMIELGDLKESGGAKKISLTGFEDEGLLTFDAFSEIVIEREMNQYATHLSIFSRYDKEAIEKVKRFQEMVLERQVPQSEADVILCTVHAAKGLEWDTVEVLDDLVPLAKFSFGDSSNDKDGFKRAREVSKPKGPASFAFKAFGDEINLWYVAVTRAKKNLIVPSKYMDVVKSLDFARRMVNHESTILFPICLPPEDDFQASGKRDEKMFEPEIKRIQELETFYRSDCDLVGAKLSVHGYDPDLEYQRYIRKYMPTEDQDDEEQEEEDDGEEHDSSHVKAEPSSSSAVLLSQASDSTMLNSSQDPEEAEEITRPAKRQKNATAPDVKLEQVEAPPPSTKARSSRRATKTAAKGKAPARRRTAVKQEGDVDAPAVPKPKGRQPKGRAKKAAAASTQEKSRRRSTRKKKVGTDEQ